MPSDFQFATVFQVSGDPCSLKGVAAYPFTDVAIDTKGRFKSQQ